MSDLKRFTDLAIAYELSDRDFRRKLALLPEDLRYYAVLANGIIGAENARRVGEAPSEVTAESDGFVSRLLEIISSPEKDEVFRQVLESCLIETLKDELRFSCANCGRFSACLDNDSLSVGALFLRRVQGEETEELKREIRSQIAIALQKTPFADSEEAHLLCRNFVHAYTIGSVGLLFGRYAEIALFLANDFGIDYRKIQQQLVSLNLQFCEKNAGHSQDS